jgi:hypothetical protein
MRRFRVVHGLAEAEARYYLSLADGDFDAASRELAQDLEVERKLGGGGAAAAAATAGGGGGGGRGGGGGGARPPAGVAAGGGGARPAAGLPAPVRGEPRVASRLAGEGATLLDVEDGGGGDEGEVEDGDDRPGSALRKRK